MARPESVMTWAVVMIFVSAAAALYLLGGGDLFHRDPSKETASILLVGGSTTVLPFAEACAQEFKRVRGVSP